MCKKGLKGWDIRMNLTIIGLGTKKGDLSLSAFERLKNASTIVLRTENTPSAAVVTESGLNYLALDYLYEKSKNFDTLTKNICKEIEKLLKKGDVCYLVDGAVSEDVCASMLIKKHKDVTVFEGVSKVAEALSLTGLGTGGYTAVSAYSLKDFNRFTLPLVIYDLDNVILASEWKLKLFSYIGEEAKVRLYIDKQLFSLPMYEIDTFNNYDYSTVLIVEELSLTEKERFDFTDLVEIVKILRSDKGCPWDRAQTKASIKKSLIEESYELCDAIDKNDDEKIMEETGDVLLQAAFYMNFAEEEGAYDRNDVLSGICKKLISRHSHIFGDDVALSPEEALTVWNKNKQVEKHLETPSEFIEDVPKNFPAALRAEKVVKRGASFSFNPAAAKGYRQRLDALLKSVEDGCLDEAVYKDIAFTAVALLKSKGFSAEDLLASATEDYIAFFKRVEAAIDADGKSIKNLSESQVAGYIDAVKKS